MKKIVKKKTGDSTTVAAKVVPVKGLKKPMDKSTSYNKTNVYKKQPVPSFPYGQEFKAVKKTVVKKPTGKK
jgi:hypothetical protein